MIIGINVGKCSQIAVKISSGANPGILMSLLSSALNIPQEEFYEKNYSVYSLAKLLTFDETALFVLPRSLTPDYTAGEPFNSFVQRTASCDEIFKALAGTRKRIYQGGCCLDNITALILNYQLFKNPNYFSITFSEKDPNAPIANATSSSAPAATDFFECEEAAEYARKHPLRSYGSEQYTFHIILLFYFKNDWYVFDYDSRKTIGVDCSTAITLKDYINKIFANGFPTKVAIRPSFSNPKSGSCIILEDSNQKEFIAFLQAKAPATLLEILNGRLTQDKMRCEIVSEPEPAPLVMVHQEAVEDFQGAHVAASSGQAPSARSSFFGKGQSKLMAADGSSATEASEFKCAVNFPQ